MKKPPYTLQDLADDFDLTLRTARYYVENVLPEHHRSGRGRAAEYGQDTWNCFAFIKKARDKDLSLAQISGVLADLRQADVDRVAEGLEELTILPVTTSAARRSERRVPDLARASERMRRYSMQSEARLEDADRDAFYLDVPSFLQREAHAMPEHPADEPASRKGEERWQLIYRDDDLQITYRGQANPEQREEVRLAATLIRRILRRK